MDLLVRMEAAKAERGWSDGEFSRQLGISQSMWSRIKHGQRSLDNVKFLRACARVLPELNWQIADYVLKK